MKALKWLAFSIIIKDKKRTGIKLKIKKNLVVKNNKYLVI